MERVPAAEGHALRQATRKLADRDIAADAGGRKGTRAARLRVARRERTGGERGLEIRRSGSAAGRVRWSLPARRVSETQTHQAPANFPAGHKRCRAPAHERARTSARRVIHTSTGAQEQTCEGERGQKCGRSVRVSLAHWGVVRLVPDRCLAAALLLNVRVRGSSWRQRSRRNRDHAGQLQRRKRRTPSPRLGLGRRHRPRGPRPRCGWPSHGRPRSLAGTGRGEADRAALDRGLLDSNGFRCCLPSWTQSGSCPRFADQGSLAEYGGGGGGGIRVRGSDAPASRRRRNGACWCRGSQW